MTHRTSPTHNTQVKRLQGFPARPQHFRLTYLLLAVLGLALGLRVWGIGFGLPYDLTYDEVHEILRAFKLGAGEYYWGNMRKGGLYYFLFVEYGLLYGVWWIMGRVADTREFALLYFQEPSAFYLVGRLTVALMGTLTCLVIYLIGRRVYDWRVGLGAAFIGATAYMHGVWSHYINVDIGMVLALWTSILAYLEYEKTKQLRWLIGAGALGGIAIAFKLPGAIVLLLLLLAIGTHAGKWPSPRQMLKEVGIVLLAMLVTVTLVAPEMMMGGMGTLPRHFSQIRGEGVASDVSYEGNTEDAIGTFVVYRERKWARDFEILLQHHNLALTFGALLGVGLGLLRRHRWDIIWGVFIVVFLGIMTAAIRTGGEYYLLPIMPGLWLLSSRAVATVSGGRRWLASIGLAGVVALPLVALGYQDYMWTRPDTRVLAKEWIEANVPAGAKILMDGMRYRFVFSPPLNPDRSTIARRIAQAEGGRRLSRGVSQRTWTLYAEAMEQVKGPTYNLYSTMYAQGVEDLTYYVQACFDYIITSSSLSTKFAHESAKKRFPTSVRFYEQLPADSRFRVVYSVTPVPWKSHGPTITVYKVVPTCRAS